MKLKVPLIFKGFFFSWLDSKNIFRRVILKEHPNILKPLIRQKKSNYEALKHFIYIWFLYLGTNIIGATSMEDMVAKLKKPKRVMLLVKAGAAVDAFIEKLVGWLTTEKQYLL